MVKKMDITSRYRPTSNEEFVGNKDILEEVISNVSDGIHVLVTGATGWGKTSMAHVVANELNLELVVNTPTDMRDKAHMEELLEATKRKSFFGDSLYLIESIDTLRTSVEGNIKKILFNLLKESKNPLFFTAIDAYKVPYHVKKYCKFYKMAEPGLGAVAKRIKEIATIEGIPLDKINFKKVNHDIRSSIIASMDGSEMSDEPMNDFECTTNVFKKHVVGDVHPAWIMDNIVNFYHGMDVYDAFKILKYAVEIDDKYLYSCLPDTRRGKVTFPYYLRRG